MNLVAAALIAAAALLIVGGLLFLWLAAQWMPRDFDEHADEAVAVANTWRDFERGVSS